MSLPGSFWSDENRLKRESGASYEDMMTWSKQKDNQDESIRTVTVHADYVHS